MKKSIYLKPVNEHDIQSYLGMLPNKKSSGIDELWNKLIKDIGPSIVTPLTHAINLALNESNFPRST